MRPRTNTALRGLLFAAGLAFASAASAEEAPSREAAQAEAPADAEAVLSMEDLASLSGGEALDVGVLTNQTLTAINGGNTVSGHTVGSGQINIDAGGLSNFSGLGNFVMNTGHNNNLQSSLNVSIVLAP